MPEFTHICHTLCLKYGQIYKPGDKIRLKKGDKSPWFKPIKSDEPEEETPADSKASDQEAPDFEEQLKALGEDKDKLEAFAKERYDVDLDKRKVPKNLIEEIRELEDIRNLDMN